MLLTVLAAPAINAQMVPTQLSKQSFNGGACRKTTAIATPTDKKARFIKQFAPTNLKVRSSSNCDPAVVLSQKLLLSDIEPNPLYCRRLRSSKVDGANYRYLDQGLVAFEKPGGELHTYQGQPDGPAGGSVIQITQTPAQTQTYGDRDWIRVKYTSRSQTQRLGWIALGSPNGLRSIANCLPGQG